MKNKEKYDLRKLEVHVRSSVNSCGRKIPPNYIQVIYEGEELWSMQTTNVMKTLFTWLEEEANE